MLTQTGASGALVIQCFRDNSYFLAVVGKAYRMGAVALPLAIYEDFS
jgi:hypothetical protein